MKRTIIICLILALCLSLGACGGSKESNSEMLAKHYRDETIKVIEKYQNGLIDAEAAETAISDLVGEWIVKDDAASMFLTIQNIRTEFYMLNSHPEYKEDSEKFIEAQKEYIAKYFD